MLDLLSKYFDSVIFITSSNWFSEPRSNRYHYASRFAKSFPVIFLQFDSKDQSIKIENTEFDNITVLRAPSCTLATAASVEVDPIALEKTLKAIDTHTGHRPLIWVYNAFAANLVKALNPSFAVYHATENYLSDKESIVSDDKLFLEHLKENVLNLIKAVDLIFAASDGVYETIVNTGLAEGKTVLNPNGVDATYWLKKTADSVVSQSSRKPAVLYQGGVNDRLDFQLILEVCSAMPEWEFWFCGSVQTVSPIWAEVCKLPNVKCFGKQALEVVAAKANEALVAWAPFLQKYPLYTSMPLKMYEYVACGLPVVSSPIRCLEDSDPRIFRFAVDAREFICELKVAASYRNDAAAIALRKELAIANSYDKKFDFACEHIIRVLCRSDKRKSILIIYDDKYATLPAIEWHLRSFERYSRNRIFYLPGSVVDGMLGADQFFEMDTGEDLDTDAGGIWDFSIFDMIIVHYSLRICIEGYIPKFIVDRLSSYAGPKILFIQDEYDHVTVTWKYIRKMGITDVFTCVPINGLDYVYPKREVTGVNFVPTMTGYIPEDRDLDGFALPLRDRPLLIGYRGRRLPHHRGLLGYEKMIIGERMKAEAESRGLPVDIETDDGKRIYDGWHKFLGSCRATLGTESGCNIFDFDGQLKKLAIDMSDKTFEEAYESSFKGLEAPFLMNQISPKFFEAIVLRTALVCFPGTYSGILEKDVHYIALEKDFSNIEEVIEKLNDDDFIENITTRAYNDVVASGRYTYRRFIEKFDDWVDNRVQSRGTEIILAPIAVRRGNRVAAIRHSDVRDYIITSTPLGGLTQREAFRAKFISNMGIENVKILSVEWFRKNTPSPVRPLARVGYRVFRLVFRHFRQ